MRFRSISMTPWQRDFALVVLPAAVLLSCAFVPKLLADSDTYWHLATGRWILEHRAVPTTDVFSYTAAGRPWVAHEWLSEVIFASVYAVGGLPGVMLLTASAVAACFAIIGVWASRRLGAVVTILTLVAVVALLGPLMLARPHALMLPILAGWTAELLAARRRGRLPSLLLLPAMVLWANLHGSYVFGIVLSATFALEALVAAEPGRRLATVLSWGAFGVGLLVAATLTPHGLMGLVFPFQLMSLENIRAINEWKSMSFDRLKPFEVVLLATIFVCLWRGVRVPVIRLALLVFLLHMALAHVRHAMVLAVVAPLILAEPLARAFPASPDSTAPLSRRERRALAGAAAVLLLAVAGVRFALPFKAPDTRNTPVTALAHVPEELRSKPVFNDYGFGGLLIFEGVRPFIDGRADMYGDAQLRRYIAINGGDRAAFDRAVRQYGIAWAIVSPRGAVARMLWSDPGWRRTYADRHAAVFERVGEAAAPAS